MKNIIITLLLFLLLGITSCSSSGETATQESESQDIYIFDDISNYDVVTTEENDQTDSGINNQSRGNYIVQVGAFSSEERAKRFVLENQAKSEWKMNISYSNTVRLYVVQLPPFSTREEAEKVRTKLWQLDAFRDAFIITVE